MSEPINIYYRDDFVYVSSQVIRSGGQIYPLVELNNFYLVDNRRRLSRLLSASSSALAHLSILLVGLVVYVALIRAIFDHPYGAIWFTRILAATWLHIIYLFGGGLLGFIVGTQLEVWFRRRSGTRLLCALFRGKFVRLYETGDDVRFGQVQRAVVRAVERAEDLRNSY